MKQVFRLAVAGLQVAALLAIPGTAAATGSACASLGKPAVPGAQVVSVSGVERTTANLPAYCDVNVNLTHPGSNDNVRVELWLPLQGWNGRFQGTGGGGFATGLFDVELGPAIQAGYAAAATDGGHDQNLYDPSSWALDASGHVNTPLLVDFASRSVHDMTVVGKAVTAEFYGRAASYSYFNGCSTGGRQGLMEAQRYPSDYNGIVADAPAINWTPFTMAQLWPQVVMNERHHAPTTCEFAAFDQAAIAACGEITSPTSCHFDPATLVGKTIVCDGKNVTITAADAEVVREIWAGPPQWYGLTPGAPFDALATAGAPFPVAANWVKYFVEQNPNFDVADLDYGQFAAIWQQSQARYGQLMGTADPDLTRFAQGGGKMVTFHGLADQLIFPAGTVNYYQRVARTMGGLDQVGQFYRLFLAPGVQHCGGGTGPMPIDPVAAVAAWVEHGVAPDTLPAATPTSTRDLCRYPLVSRYNGSGDPNSAASYHCA